MLKRATHIVVNKVQVVSGRDGHGAPTPLGDARVRLVEGLVHVDEAIDDCVAMTHGQLQAIEAQVQMVGRHVLERKAITDAH